MTNQRNLIAPITVTAIGMIAITVGIMQVDMIVANVGVLVFIGGFYTVWYRQMVELHG